MGLFNKLFSKETSSNEKLHKGFYALSVQAIDKLNKESVAVTLSVPSHLSQQFKFKAGQHLTFIFKINNEEYRRSYSICSGTDEPLKVAVKRVDGGKVSNYMNDNLQVGDVIQTSLPEGHFIYEGQKNTVAIAAGSGITPILSIAKSITENNASLELFYGNRSLATTMFKNELDELKGVITHYYFSKEEVEGSTNGRITKESFIAKIKENLELLKADAFYICGPEEMIFEVKDALTMFGVPDSKIHFELFTTPTKQNEPVIENTFKGSSQVKVIVDDEEYDFDLDAKGKTILDKADMVGADVPYSCKGGVCSTCRAKVLEGKAIMDLNYSLTDSEIEQGYILACQAHPASEKLTVSFDE